ncbi:MAG: class I SAM-dependent methyltransferase [Betaproteobacteria bacterium]|nr:MAG: class I SAM-dependent methyltransferase [Betaproteobacteria bacterium]
MRRLALVAVALLGIGAARADEALAPVPFITTPDEVVERMLKLAGTGPRDLVIDLGSGDGRIVIAAAEKFGARGLGIELDGALIEKSRANARRANVADRVSFLQGDVLTADISQATVVTVYLLPGLINQLEPRFLESLRPGTRIVSHAFAMTSWRPDRAETMRISKPHPGQGDESRLYLWIVPAEVRGVWQAPGTRLAIYQNFQEIQIEGRLAGREITESRAALIGRDITWEANRMRFRGRIQDDRIAGELERPDGRTPLILTRAR